MATSTVCTITVTDADNAGVTLMKNAYETSLLWTTVKDDIAKLRPEGQRFALYAADHVVRYLGGGTETISDAIDMLGPRRAPDPENVTFAIRNVPPDVFEAAYKNMLEKREEMNKAYNVVTNARTASYADFNRLDDAIKRITMEPITDEMIADIAKSKEELSAGIAKWQALAEAFAPLAKAEAVAAFECYGAGATDSEIND